jgi:hypothetical protein
MTIKSRGAGTLGDDRISLEANSPLRLGRGSFRSADDPARLRAISGRLLFVSVPGFKPT